MKKISIKLLLILLTYNAIGQDDLIYYITKVKDKSSSIELSLSNLDSVVNNGKRTKLIDSATIYRLENQGYLRNKFLRILDYMPSGQATFSVYEFKIIDFNNTSYLFYSKKIGLNEPCGAFIFDSLTIYRIENKEITIDNTLKNNIENFRKYKYFTNNSKLIEKSHKKDFCYDLIESKENEILIELNLSCSQAIEIEKKLINTKLKIKFGNEKFETYLIEN